MNRPIPTLLLLAALVVPLSPRPASSQMAGTVSVVPVRARSMSELCGARNAARPQAWRSLLAIRARADGDAREDLIALQDSLEVEAGARPDDLELRYVLAAVLGARTDFEGARARMGIARELRARTIEILAVEPDHPGANYLLGRLHAAVMRMDRVSRFLATQVMGGSALSDASWHEARARLEIAAAGDPCVPDHHFELARVYADRGEAGLARDQLRNLLHLSAEGASFERTLTEGRAMLIALEGR